MGQPINDYQSSLAMTIYLPLTGVYPPDGGSGTPYFYLGELGIFAGDFDPAGDFADGQLLPIQQNTALFAVLGTTYGGNGTNNFALPNLQGRVPIGVNSNISLGSQGGVLNREIDQSPKSAAKIDIQGTPYLGMTW